MFHWLSAQAPLPGIANTERCTIVPSFFEATLRISTSGAIIFLPHGPDVSGIFWLRDHRNVQRTLPNAYVNNAESKFNGPDGNQCYPWTRGILQRMHVVAGKHRYCGKEFKRKLEQGPVDHEVEFQCKVYENRRVAADAETLRQLARYSEREIRAGTGLRRDTIRLIRHGHGVKRSTYERVIDFLQNIRPRPARELGSWSELCQQLKNTNARPGKEKVRSYAL